LQYLIDFLEVKDVKNSKIFEHLKCSEIEAKILKKITQSYISGSIEVIVLDVLTSIFGEKNYTHITKLPHIKNLLDQGWITHGAFVNLKVAEVSNLELLNSSISLSNSFLKLLEEGTLDIELPEITPYSDHLEYLKDQFLRIEMYQKLSLNKQNLAGNSVSASRLKAKLGLLESRIKARLEVSETQIVVEKIFEEHGLNQKEQIIFLALLKEEYAGELESLRDMNTLISLISFDDYEKIQNRALLEEGSKLIEEDIIDYDEMLNGFGGVSRSFFISEEILQKIMHPNKDKKAKKIKLDMLIKEQELFELIEPKTTLDDVVLTPKTRDSKYVGESEQNVRKIFDTFKELSQKTKSEPVLLLNEADQFLSTRVSESGSSSDKMHNQMQNIFLEQIEKFNGVLIATTNMLDSIDPAFSRRFDYKIEFSNPDFKQRAQLWQKLLPESAVYEENFSIEELAKYKLSG